jgi:hypothetical protein
MVVMLCGNLECPELLWYRELSELELAAVAILGPGFVFCLATGEFDVWQIE